MAYCIKKLSAVCIQQTQGFCPFQTINLDGIYQKLNSAHTSYCECTLDIQKENTNQHRLFLMIYEFILSHANSNYTRELNNPCFVKLYFSFPFNGISKLLSTL